jgi:exosortase/archaeosortase family protein
MSPSKKEVSTVSQSEKSSFSLKEEWNTRAVILKPLLFFVGIMILFYAIWATQFFQENILSKVAAANASAGSFLLNLFGMETNTINERIVSKAFSVNVKAGCDGIEAIMLCVAGMLVFPAKWGQKLKGIFVGVSFLLLLNLFRIMTLYLTGLYYRKAFDFMHLDFWQVLFIILAIITVLIWIQWVNKQNKTELA